MDSWIPEKRAFPEYVLIQDIHRHPEVQANIAAILLAAYHRWGIREVFVEGLYAHEVAERPTGTETSLREAMRAGQLSGAEAANALSGNDLNLCGLEDPRLYRENMQAFDQVRNQTAGALRELKTLQMMQRAFDVSGTRDSLDHLDEMELMVRLRIKPSEWSAFLKTPWTIPTSPALASALKEAEHFYQVVDQRSQIFVETTEETPLKGPRVLIIGGFHTARVAELLRSRGRSYVVLSPRVTESGYDNLYESRMQESISALKIR